jgi:hypothetical protein
MIRRKPPDVLGYRGGHHHVRRRRQLPGQGGQAVLLEARGHAEKEVMAMRFR